MAGYRAPAEQAATPGLIARHLQWISGGVLIGAAALSFPGREYLIVGLLLFLPLADRHWPLPVLPRTTRHYLSWAGLLLAMTALLAWQPSYFGYAATTLMFAAFPEEWFFRGYFMQRLGNGLRANLITSCLFALLHGLSRDWITGLLVFAPSLFYGWLYQRTRDLPLLILVHALSNLVFALFLAQPLTVWLSDLR
jgi:membrane protease YdiL (CAAX protease family)